MTFGEFAFFATGGVGGLAGTYFAMRAGTEAGNGLTTVLFGLLGAACAGVGGFCLFMLMLAAG